MQTIFMGDLMNKIAFFDAKSYDIESFDKHNKNYEIIYFENKLDHKTAKLAEGCDAVCVFVNDIVDKKTIDILYDLGIKIIALRCAGYNNIEFKYAYNKIKVVRVPAYSPYSVAEFAMAMLQVLNRKLHKAYNRTRDFNFSIEGFTGMDLHGKTVGVIGTGKIGRVFIDICKGYGMKVIAYDKYPAKDADIDYVELDTLFKESDIISLHCPLTSETYNILDDKSFKKMKKGVYIINTSRGPLIESNALLDALNDEIVKGACLDVYDEEAKYFYEDFSGILVKDEVLSLLITRPNVLISSHQAFLTSEALENIAQTTLKNLDEFFENKKLSNEIVYK